MKLAETAALSGKPQEALQHYKTVVERDPSHVWALVEIGNTLYCLGRSGESRRFYEMALEIDESFAPALVNLALRSNEAYRSRDAIELLERAREVAPNQPHIDATLASTYMTRGDAYSATQYHLSAWLKRFDAQEPAHCYLFAGSYSERFSPDAVAAEHAFWADTLKPSELDLSEPHVSEPTGRRLRIGYISPDFRNHSVRFFFRPLLEGHDQSRVEIFCYHDYAGSDHQTELIRKRASHFREIANLPDSEVARIILADKLDALVELCGHTSISRLQLMSNRLARFQLTGLGYPPTTGLRTIDYKIVDAITCPPASDRLYSERLLRLPECFWCFNPLEPTADAGCTPFSTNGFITFGCFGNVAKISDTTLQCWSRILAEVPGSRLILKAMTFQDEDALQSVRSRLIGSGIAETQFQLEQPDAPDELFSAYNRIDILLDTFPFNGGTTSCFTLWMGVPIVTLRGEQLPSRMSASMLHVLGLDHLTASTSDEYVAIAIRLASDAAALADMKSSIRARMLDSALSDGGRYARQLEDALFELATTTTSLPARACTPVLAEAEICRRAQFVLFGSQFEAARRIIDYALRHYPNSSPARILSAEILERKQDQQGAMAELDLGISLSDAGSAPALHTNKMRLLLTAGRFKETLDYLEPSPLDELGAATVHLYRCVANAAIDQSLKTPGPMATSLRVVVLVRTRSTDRARLFEQALDVALGPGSFRLARQDDRTLIEAIKSITLRHDEEALLVLDEDTEPANPGLAHAVQQSLDTFDITSCAGSSIATGTSWKDAPFQSVAGAVLYADQSRDVLELCCYGPPRSSPLSPARMLDPSFMVISASALSALQFDSEIDGDHGFALVDAALVAATRGLRTGVNSELLAIQHQPMKRGAHWHRAAAFLSKKHMPDNANPEAFSPFESLRPLGCTAPVTGGSHACAAVRGFNTIRQPPRTEG